MSIRRRVFSGEFKLHVLAEVARGTSQAELARRYQILPKLISRWLGEQETHGEQAFLDGSFVPAKKGALESD